MMDVFSVVGMCLMCYGLCELYQKHTSEKTSGSAGDVERACANTVYVVDMPEV